MAGRGRAELVVDDRPAGQGTGGLLDVAFGVMADAEREELHQLSRQVLVGMSLAVGRRVEPDQQGRVADESIEQLGEGGAGVPAEDVVLPPHRGEAADFHVAGCEMVVPEERQPLAERVGPEQHAVDPPRLQPRGVVGSDRRVGQQRRGGIEVVGNAVAAGLAVEEADDTGLRAIFQVAPQLVPGGGEPRAAVQVDHPAQVPGGRLVGDVRGPGVSVLEGERCGHRFDLLTGFEAVLPSERRPGPCTRPGGGPDPWRFCR
jgi:hypothetical protein